MTAWGVRPLSNYILGAGPISYGNWLWHIMHVLQHIYNDPQEFLIRAVLPALCRVLFWRELLSVSRNPADAAGRILVFSYTGLLCGLFFYNLSTGFEGLRSRLNLFYIEAFFLVLLPHVYMSLYTADKQYFLADTSAKLYRPSAYYIAKQLAALPFNIGVSLAFVLLVYGMSGLRWQAGAVLAHTGVNVLLYLVAAQVKGRLQLSYSITFCFSFLSRGVLSI